MIVTHFHEAFADGKPGFLTLGNVHDLALLQGRDDGRVVLPREEMMGAWFFRTMNGPMVPGSVTEDTACSTSVRSGDTI